MRKKRKKAAGGRGNREGAENNDDRSRISGDEETKGEKTKREMNSGDEEKMSRGERMDEAIERNSE